MKSIPVFVLSSVALFGQISFTPTTCTLTEPQGGPSAFGCAFSITGSGTAALTRGDFFPSIGWFDANGTPTTQVTAPATIYLRCAGNCDDRPAGSFQPTMDIPAINGVPVPTTLDVQARMMPVYSNYRHVPDSALNCTNTSALLWDYHDTCVLTSQTLGFYSPPPKGSPYADQVFGTPIWHLANTYHDYAVINIFSSDDQYVIVCNSCESNFGETGIYSTVTKQKVYKTPCEQFTVCGGAYFSLLHPDRLYVLVRNGWHQYHFGAPPDLVDDGLAYQAPAGESVDSGGSMVFTPEDYEVHWEYSQASVRSVSGNTITASAALAGLAPGKVVTINNAADPKLNGAWVVQAAPTPGSFTIGYTPTATGGTVTLWDRVVVYDLEHRAVLLNFPYETIPSQPMATRTVHISSRDIATGKYFIIVEDDYSTENQNHYYAARYLSFQPGDTTPTFEFYGPATPGVTSTNTPRCTFAVAEVNGNCFGSAHSTELNVNGVAYFLHVGGRQDPYQSYVTAHRLNAGDDSATSIYLGGGYNWWNTAPDHMAGARLAPFIASSGDTPVFDQVFSTNIASVSGNLYTTDYPHGLSVNDAVIVAVDSSSTTDPALDGTYTVRTVPRATSFTIDRSPSSYQENSAIVYKAGTDPLINSGGPQVQVCRPLPDGRLLQCRRIAMHLSTQFSASFHDTGYSGQTTANDYFAQPHVVLSPNGKWVGWTSNLMHGNNDYFYIAPTGFDGALDPNQFTPATSVQVSIQGATAAFHLTVPDTQTYTLEVCTDSGLSLCVPPISLSGSQLAVDATVTGLTASTQYFWRARSADDYYLAAGSFMTDVEGDREEAVSPRSRPPARARQR